MSMEVLVNEMTDIRDSARFPLDLGTVTSKQLQSFTHHSSSINFKPEIRQSDLGDCLSSLAWSHSERRPTTSDQISSPSPSLPMLEAIITTSLGDGDMDEDKTTNSLQEYVAGLVGHEASLLVVSGTMGNQVALRSALGAPLTQSSPIIAHIIILEGGGASSLCGAMIKMVVPSNGHHLTLADIQKHATLTESIYDCPTRIISLENTLWGTIMPLSEIRAIARWARAQTPPIHMHLDGARVWEAVAAGAFTLLEIGECFDSIQMCFTKGLGAPIGSIITGSAAFIKRAKWARKLLGGSTRSSGVIAAPARVAINEVFLGGKLKAAQDKARYASALWEELGGKLQVPTETNLIWIDLEASGVKAEDFYPVANSKEFDLKIGAPIFGRVAVHYQITDGAFKRLCDFFRAVLENKNDDGS